MRGWGGGVISLVAISASGTQRRTSIHINPSRSCVRKDQDRILSWCMRQALTAPAAIDSIFLHGHKQKATGPKCVGQGQRYRCAFGVHRSYAVSGAPLPFAGGGRDPGLLCGQPTYYRCGKCLWRICPECRAAEGSQCLRFPIFPLRENWPQCDGHQHGDAESAPGQGQRYPGIGHRVGCEWRRYGSGAGGSAAPPLPDLPPPAGPSHPLLMWAPRRPLLLVCAGREVPRLRVPAPAAGGLDPVVAACRSSRSRLSPGTGRRPHLIPFRCTWFSPFFRLQRPGSGEHPAVGSEGAGG